MPPSSTSFTVKYEKLTGILSTPVDIFPAFDPSDKGITHPRGKKYIGIWDTGATGSAITAKVATDLGLKPISMAEVSHAQGKTITNVYLVNVKLPNKVGFTNLRVIEGILSSGVDALIGMDIICSGDFAVTHKNNKTTFTYRYPSIAHIDFVAEGRGTEFSSVGSKVGRNEPCPCGSGKKYKKCHGR
ncbi:MAG: SEC-C metal-binding domain-containing protein [Nitrospinota bacterium]